MLCILMLQLTYAKKNYIRGNNTANTNEENSLLRGRLFLKLILLGICFLALFFLLYTILGIMPFVLFAYVGGVFILVGMLMYLARIMK